MNKRCGLERLARTLPSQTSCGELSQFVVDQRQQVAGSLLFATAESVQDLSDCGGVGFDGDRPFLAIAG